MRCAPIRNWTLPAAILGIIIVPGQALQAAFEDSPDVQVFVPGLGTQYKAIETAVAVHPEQDATILAACMIVLGTTAYDVAAFVSTDAGNSWATTPSLSPEAQGTAGDDFADPVVAWVRSGSEWTAVVGFMAELVDNVGRSLKIARSTDLGGTWVSSNVTYRAAGGGLDKPWMAATHDGTGHIHLAYMAKDVAPDSLKIEVVRSTNAGATWSSARGSP